MVLDPATKPVDRVRLRIADFSDIPLLSDDVIQYYITKNSSNETTAARECALVILGVLARDASYNKIDALIVDGKNAYNSYKDYLLKLIADPRISLSIPVSYFGGVSINDMNTNSANLDVNIRPQFTENYLQYTDNTDFIRTSSFIRG